MRQKAVQKIKKRRRSEKRSALERRPSLEVLGLESLYGGFNGKKINLGASQDPKSSEIEANTGTAQEQEGIKTHDVFEVDQH